MKSLSRVLLAAVVLVFSMQSLAEDAHGKPGQHPRRKEVMERAQKEKNANNAAAVNGKITTQQAQQLDKKDNRIERQAQREAAKNGGALTKKEQNQLNREENQVNRQRRQDERKDAAGAAAQPSTPAPTQAPAPTPAPTPGN